MIVPVNAPICVQKPLHWYTTCAYSLLKRSGRHQQATASASISGSERAKRQTTAPTTSSSNHSSIVQRERTTLALERQEDHGLCVGVHAEVRDVAQQGCHHRHRHRHKHIERERESARMSVGSHLLTCKRAIQRSGRTQEVATWRRCAAQERMRDEREHEQHDLIADTGGPSVLRPVDLESTRHNASRRNRRTATATKTHVKSRTWYTRHQLRSSSSSTHTRASDAFTDSDLHDTVVRSAPRAHARDGIEDERRNARDRLVPRRRAFHVVQWLQATQSAQKIEIVSDGASSLHHALQREHAPQTCGRRKT